MEQQINNGYDFGNAHDPNISILLATTSDELGSVLRAHFCLEEFLDVWCNTITGVKDFLDIGFIGFDKKLAIAKKLGLGDDQALAFKEFNKLRNSYAHDSSFQLTREKLNSLKNNVDSIVAHHNGEVLPSCESRYLELEGNGRKITWNAEDTTDHERFILLYLHLSMKLYYRFSYDFLERGIPFNKFNQPAS
ncbi:hypothetical protein [Acinetobacter johnsonii]|uniref:hypothetical protein n=1 Tax=Acinetobacter johnsonii TaxID=40214 RepID=UPI00300A9F86